MSANPRILPRIAGWLDRHEPSGSLVLGTAATLIGLLGGAGVWAFQRLIALFHRTAFGGLGGLVAPLGRFSVVVVPVVGGLVVGLILYLFVGRERHHGVAGIMEAVALAGGRLRYRRMPAKAVAAALAIGSGASVGPEDPSVQIGANVGSMFGQWLELSGDRVRALVAAGAAAGIAAAFNAPIAGVFFALEIVLGEIGGNAFGVVVLAGVVSAVFTQVVSGTEPAFHVPAYAFHSAWELPLYFGLGLLAGPVAALYIRLLYLAQDLFRLWRVPRWVKPAAAGLGVGLVGVFLPQLFGVGYDTIETLITGQSLTLIVILALLAGKLVLTPLSIGAGFPGGVFAPSLYLGATLGAAYGLAASFLFPSLQIDPPAFAMVGMAAVLAGAVHAPLTAVILLFEMTNDYRIILPLMLAVIVSLVISQRLHHDSVYTLALARKGVRIERGRDVEVLQAITVGEVMQTNAPHLLETDSLSTASERMLELRYHGLPVLNERWELTGIATVTDIDRAQSEVAEGLTVGDVATRDLLIAYPDETLGAALRRMSVRDVGRLPVVSPDDPKRMLGVLRRTDVVRAYDAALTRRAAVRHRTQQAQLGALADVAVTEVVVEEGSSCAGKAIRDVEWPHESVIASVQRGRQLIVPHGETVLAPGDVLAIVGERVARATVERICAAAVPVTSPAA